MFYLGAHRPGWLAESTVPLFVSRRVLAGRKRLPRATTIAAASGAAFLLSEFCDFAIYTPLARTALAVALLALGRWVLRERDEDEPVAA